MSDMDLDIKEDVIPKLFNIHFLYILLMSIIVKSAAIGSSVVTDGLVLYLDSINEKSYPGVGVNWYDISGNDNHHTIVGAPIYTANKEFLLDGTEGFTYNSSMTTSTTCTVMIIYKTTDTPELWVKGNTTSFYLSASNFNNYYHANCGSPVNYVDLLTTIRPDSPINYRNDDYHMWEAKNVNFNIHTGNQ